MSLDRFKAAFTITANDAGQGFQSSSDFGIESFALIVSELGGKTFNNGLYRVLRTDQVLEQGSNAAVRPICPWYRVW